MRLPVWRRRHGAAARVPWASVRLHKDGETTAPYLLTADHMVFTFGDTSIIIKKGPVL